MAETSCNKLEAKFRICLQFATRETECVGKGKARCARRWILALAGLNSGTEPSPPSTFWRRLETEVVSFLVGPESFALYSSLSKMPFSAVALDFGTGWTGL